MFFVTWLPYRQDGTVAVELTVPSRIMYLSMVICIYISVSAIGAFDMSVPFRGEILGTGRSALQSIRPRSIRPTSAPNAVVPPRVLGRSAPGAGSFRPNTPYPVAASW